MGRDIQMIHLMKRIERVQNEIGIEKNEEEEEERKGLNDFDRIKKQAALQLRELREKIRERDQMGNNCSKREKIEMNQNIRKGLKEVKDSYELLERQFEKDKKKGGIVRKKMDEEELENRKKQVQNVKDHIKEVEGLKNRAYAVNREGSNNRPSAASQFTHVKDIESLPDNPEESNLPEIDISEDLAQIHKNDQEIDEGLDRIHSSVKRLGNMAKEYKTELETQDVMLQEIENKMEKNQEDINNLNSKLKKTLDQAGGCTRFIFVIIGVAIVISLVGVVWQIVSRVI